MTYEQYIHASPEELTAVKEAQNIKFDLRNQDMWLQGMYIQTAVGVVIANVISKNKNYKYFEQPIDVFGKHEAEEREKAQEKITAHLQALNADWQRRYGNQNKRT